MDIQKSNSNVFLCLILYTQKIIPLQYFCSYIVVFIFRGQTPSSGSSQQRAGGKGGVKCQAHLRVPVLH